MIKSWTLENFKSVYDETALPFAPLTLFAGGNSSGKSTLIQSILLTAQTIQSSVTSRNVVLNGHIVRLGAFNDILSNGANKREITIGFELTPPSRGDVESVSRFSRYYYSQEMLDAMASVKCSYTFSANGPESLREVRQLQPQLEAGTLSFFADGDKEKNWDFAFVRRSENSEDVLRRYQIHSRPLSRSDESGLEFQIAPDVQESVSRGSSYYPAPTGAVPEGVILRHFLPSAIAVVYDTLEDAVQEAFRLLANSDPSRLRYSRQNQPVNELISDAWIKDFFVANANSLWSPDVPPNPVSRGALTELKANFNSASVRQFYDRIPSHYEKRMMESVMLAKESLLAHLRGNRAQDFRVAAIPGPDTLTFSTDFVGSYFSERVKYLGPLRDEPKPIYPLSGNSEPTDIGFRGEHTAAVLELHKSTLVSYVSSDQFPFNRSSRRLATEVPLYEAVHNWLLYIGIGHNFSTQDQGKLGHELKVATSSGSVLHDLTHVGVGVSQALPILVLSLLADRGSTLIFEQPELHLHPRVQTRLADFFVSLIMDGKQCIVETHSEYMINRLRFLAAVSDESRISSMVRMYFVEKDGDRSTYNQVLMSANGVIKNWPVGFFDESERNSAAIIEAQLARRRNSNRHE